MPPISAAADFNAAPLSSSRRCRIGRSLWKVLTLSDHNFRRALRPAFSYALHCDRWRFLMKGSAAGTSTFVMGLILTRFPSGPIELLMIPSMELSHSLIVLLTSLWIGCRSHA